MAMKKLKYFNSGKEIHVAKVQENDWNSTEPAWIKVCAFANIIEAKVENL